jgi:hypothetical protein
MAATASARSDRKTAVIVGVLFIIATAFLYIGRAVYDPILNSPDYLTIAYPNRIAASIGILLEFACVVAIPLIPVFAYPVLKKYSEPLALGYVGFRLLEAVFFVFTEINELSLISVSQGYLSGGEADAAYFRNLGGSILARNQWMFLMYVIIFTLGGMMFYAVLYKSRLVPRFISAWGFAAEVLLLVGIVLVMLEMNTGPLGNVWELIFAAPIAVQEMVMALWLIVKGFNAPATTSEPTRAKIAAA